MIQNTYKRIVKDGKFCIEYFETHIGKSRIIFESKSEIETMRRYKRLKELEEYENSLWDEFFVKQEENEEW